MRFKRNTKKRCISYQPIYFINKKMEFSTYATKTYINHHQNITVDEKLAIKNLKPNKDIIIHSADKGGKILIINRKESIEEFKKQQSDSTFCKQTDGFNQQNKKVRNEIMKLNTNNYISEKNNTNFDQNISILPEHQSSMDLASLQCCFALIRLQTFEIEMKYK